MPDKFIPTLLMRKPKLRAQLTQNNAAKKQ